MKVIFKVDMLCSSFRADRQKVSLKPEMFVSMYLILKRLKI